MGLGEDNNCPSFLAGYSALSCLVPRVTNLLLVALSSIWLRLDSLFYLRALGMLSLMFRSIILLWV
jgi:hypothetical protein